MIARRTPLKRSTKPLKRTSRPARVRRSKAGQEKHRKDRAWSEAVKAKGPCVALDVPFKVSEDFATVTHTLPYCRGPIDPAHVLSRTFPATRHEVANGVPLCRAAHDWFGVRPLAWTAFCRQLLGNEEYDRLDAKAHGNISR